MDIFKEKKYELEEDIQLIEIAKKRVKKFTSNNVITHEDLLKRYNIEEGEIDELVDVVEIE